MAHYVVLNNLRDVEAKRAALQTSFCPPELRVQVRRCLDEASCVFPAVRLSFELCPCPVAAGA